jgi:uncharacterized protein
MDKVQHFEIPADDVARARKFYENTFGWRTVEWPMPGGDVYIGLHTGGPVDPQKPAPMEPGYINGGMYKRSGKFAKSVVITPVVQDMNASIEKVRRNGGKIVSEPQTIPGKGIYAYIEDSEGNVIGLWQELKKS